MVVGSHGRDSDRCNKDALAVHTSDWNQSEVHLREESARGGGSGGGGHGVSRHNA